MFNPPIYRKTRDFFQKIKAWESQSFFPSLLDVPKSNEWSDD